MGTVIPWHQNWTANADKIPQKTNCIKSWRIGTSRCQAPLLLWDLMYGNQSYLRKQPGFECCTLKAANWLRPFGFNWPGPTDQFTWCLCQTLSENGTYIVTIIFCVRTPYFWIWYMVWSYNLLTSVASCTLGPKPPTHVSPLLHRWENASKTTLQVYVNDTFRYVWDDQCKASNSRFYSKQQSLGNESVHRKDVLRLEILQNHSLKIYQRKRL